MKNIHLSRLMAKAITVAAVIAASPVFSQITTQTFFATGSLQSFTVPPCISNMTIEARGAQGGSLSVYGNGHQGGMGSIMRGVFNVTQGQVLTIVAGSRGNPDPSSSGGGGASGVALGNVPWIVAGGGAGVDFQNLSYSGMHAVTGTGGNPGNGSGPGAGGTNGGDGGDHTYSGSHISRGGRGWNFNNAGSFGNNGVSASTTTTSGTFGLGGGGGSVGYGYCNCGGGGGGYSGGGSAAINNSGGGGGSYNAGSNQLNTAGTHTGAGMVILTYGMNGNAVSATVSPAFICSGSSASLTASGMVSYTWSGGASSNNSSLVVNPTSSTTYTVAGTNSVGCITTSILTLTVTSGVPVLTVSTSTTNLCLGRTATLSASGAITYTWSHGVVNNVSFTPTVTTSYTVSGQNGCGISTAVTTITVAPLPVTAIVQPTLTCAGQPATLTAASGVNGYTWSPGSMTSYSAIVAPSSNQQYTVAASDGTCSGVAVVSLSVNPNPTLSISASSSVVCQGGSAVLTASGANSYTWTPGNLTVQTVTVNPTAPTLYVVTGTNNFGCSSSANQVVLTAASPTVNVAATKTLICAGEAVTFTASGASAYSWNTGHNMAIVSVTPGATTIYTVTGTSGNNCSSDKIVTIVVFTPTVSIAPSSSSVCPGASATLTASGANSYVWSNLQTGPVAVVTPTAASYYTVTATSSSNAVNCSSTATVMVDMLPSPTVTAVSSRTAICRNEKQVLTAGGANTYTWSNNVAAQTITISSSVATTLNYTVNGTDANGCKGNAKIQVKVNSCTGLEERASVAINVFPNPNRGDFTIMTDGPLSLELYNALGQKIDSMTIDHEGGYRAVVHGLAPGVYFLVGVSGSGVSTKSLVVER
jgi:hypothetical protein